MMRCHDDEGKSRRATMLDAEEADAQWMLNEMPGRFFALGVMVSRNTRQPQWKDTILERHNCYEDVREGDKCSVRAVGIDG